MRNSRSVWVWLVAAVTLGSGLANLFSAAGRTTVEHRHFLREFFPLEFLHLSRSLTLVIGFALVILSINIYKRKRRAWELVLVLACLSVVFHLTKGLDYAAAIFSLLLAGILWRTRRHFMVKSSLPDLGGSLLRIGLALLMAVTYGVVGFWFLDPREFGIDFGLMDSLHRTFLFLTLVGDPEIVPQTRFAYWFLDSLYLLTYTAFAYSGFALFRPVIHRFRTLPRERALAAEIVARHGRSSLEFFKLWPDKSYFFSPSHRCFLAYGVAAHFAVVLADPVGPEEEIEETARLFAELASENDWGLAFYQTLPDFLPTYQRLGFRKLKIGDDAIVDLAEFSLEGKSRKKLRHYMNQFEKSGLRGLRYEPPLAEEILAQAQEVSDDWLEIPGRRERGFTLGQFAAHYVRTTPLFAAVEPSGRLLAFVNLIPSSHADEATIDLMRHRTAAPHGVMDYLFAKLFLDLRQRGFQRFNLGMAPMAGFQEKEEATPAERAVHYFFQNLNFLFSYTGLREYKAKFASSWEPRYVIYRNPLELPRLVLALRALAERKV